MKEPSLHPQVIHAQEYAPWCYFFFLVFKEECLRACSHPPPGLSPPSKCGEGWSWREGGERLCVRLLPPAPLLCGGGGQASTGTRGVRWSAWLHWKEAAGSWTPGPLTSPSSPTRHTCKKRVMLRRRLFWPKKIAEKVRKSQQNVNRDKSA